MKLTWTKEAEELISKVPGFVRPMAMKKIEKIAKERVLATIDSDLVTEVKAGSMGRGKSQPIQYNHINKEA